MLSYHHRFSSRNVWNTGLQNTGWTWEGQSLDATSSKRVLYPRASTELTPSLCSSHKHRSKVEQCTHADVPFPLDTCVAVGTTEAKSILNELAQYQSERTNYRIIKMDKLKTSVAFLPGLRLRLFKRMYFFFFAITISIFFWTSSHLEEMADLELAI